jgi:hypothetical protein
MATGEIKARCLRNEIIKEIAMPDESFDAVIIGGGNKALFLAMYLMKYGGMSVGDHPVTDQLRGMGLKRRPLISSWIGRLALDVSAPERL